MLGEFIDSILDLDPGANIIALGDFNDFEFSETLEPLLAGRLTSLIDTLPPEEQYTYVFEGNSQTLDHILVSDGALARTAGFDPVHVNAEFFEQTSDHDPSVARFLVNAAPVVDAGGPYSVPEGDSVTLTATASDPDGDPVSVEWDLDGDGVFEASGTSVVFSAAAIDGPATVTVTVRASDGITTSTDTATVAVLGVTFDSLCALTRAYSNDPAVAGFLCAVLDAAERTRNPILRQAIMSGYRLAVALETGNRPRDAFTPAEGATLQRLSRSL